MIFSGHLFQVSFDALWAHKLRTFLTMLGIIFGVSAVISMLSIGEGAKQEVLEQISILGINNIIVNAKIPDNKSSSDIGVSRSPGLTLADAENIASFKEMVANIVPQRFEQVRKVYCGSEETSARVVSTIPAYIYSSSVEVDKGRFINDIDNQSYAQVCVLGAKAKRQLFAFKDPIGRTVRIGDENFTVIGVMTDKYIGRGKVEGFELRNLNEDIYIPFNTAVKKIERVSELGTSSGTSFRRFTDITSSNAANLPEIDQLTVTVSDLDYVEPLTKLIEKVLSRRHYGVDDYEIVVPESLLRQSQKTQKIFNIVMGTIAGISLIVGGIGIMNIMLATVLERTREIGIRRAVGATQKDILRQFLIEAVFICLVGCFVGVVLGLILAKVISYYADWPTIVSLYSIVLAVGVSTAVGLIFGIFPATKAAKLDVIEALRYE